MKNKEANSIFSSLENYSSTPPPDLWDKIEAQLDKPKKKKRPLIWWWVAAGFMAGLSVPTLWYVSTNQNNVLELNQQNDSQGVVLQNDSDANFKEHKKINATENNAAKTTNTQEHNDALIQNKNENTANTNDAVVINSNRINTLTSDKVIRRSKRNGFVSNNSITNGLTEIVANEHTSRNTNNAKATTANPYLVNEKIATTTSKAVTHDNKNNVAVIEKPKSVVDTEYIRQSLETSKAITSNFDNTKSNADATIRSNSLKDSLNQIQKEVTQLENVLADLDKKDKIKKKSDSDVVDKWSLQVFAGVMNSENYSNDKLLGNTVGSKQSSGYGFKTNYKLNKKWALSSGFKINELGQTIDGVAYYERGGVTNKTSGLLPIESNNMTANNLSQNSTVVFVSTNQNYLFAADSKGATGYETGNVTQNLKYFEMPLEISYAIMSKKRTNISMNTGGFVGKLISNDLLLNGSSIGENSNINEYVYGTLLSSTLQYEFYKKTKFFIEPGMNYYINPSENQSFNQFQWMFNVGLNFAF
ncbi:anti-sigma factor [Flavobacterium adhaerens]|uniref:anti-sigma factor n=1 Tax=Flavobacterium adhaerens TaxID=3149043 RepID=UPI0032B3136C